MTWYQFFGWLGAIYLMYYALIISRDLLKTRQIRLEESGKQELFFAEDCQPKEVVLVEDPAKASVAGTLAASIDEKAAAGIGSGKAKYSGAVNMKALTNLVKADLISYTKAIPY